MSTAHARIDALAPARSRTLALACALRPAAERGGRRVALVQEGGGMRGAFGAGVQIGFAEAGVPYDAFDALYGTSAGVLNFMYWVSQRTRPGSRVYIDELTREATPSFFMARTLPRFCLRLMLGKPVINLHAVEVAMTQARPIDLDAILSYPVPIMFPITHADDLNTEFADVRDLPRDDLLPTLLAAASVPVLADAYDLRHGRYIDGACGSPLPVLEALASGYTDIVVIVSLPPPKGPAWYESLILYALAARRGLTSRVGTAVRGGRRARRAALGVLEHPPTGVNITVIAPPARLIRSLEKDPAIVERAVNAGISAATRAVELARIDLAVLGG